MYIYIYIYIYIALSLSLSLSPPPPPSLSLSLSLSLNSFFFKSILGTVSSRIFDRSSFTANLRLLAFHSPKEKVTESRNP